MSMLSRQNWFEQKASLMLALLVFIIAAVVVLSFVQFPPIGRFQVKEIACEGTAYWEFKNGKIIQNVPLGGERGMSYEIQQIGTYVKDGDRWLWVTPSGERFYIKITWHSLEVSNLDGSQARKYPRLIAFKRAAKRID